MRPTALYLERVLMGDREQVKEALKEAIKEWLDDKFLIFGKWSAAAVSAMIFSALIYFVLKMNGWKPS
jgi:hypothetical protein